MASEKMDTQIIIGLYELEKQVKGCSGDILMPVSALEQFELLSRQFGLRMS